MLGPAMTTPDLDILYDIIQVLTGKNEDIIKLNYLLE